MMIVSKKRADTKDSIMVEKTQQEIDEILYPSLISEETLWKLTAVFRAYFSPSFFGMEKIDPAIPSLFVGNHTVYGVFDSPVLLAELLHTKGIRLRSLGDRFHFRVPFWRDIFKLAGAVEGTPENCSLIMEDGQHLLIFPGGGREVCKRKGESYELIWKQRIGFVRLAVKHSYPIIPFAAKGVDSAYTIVLDATDFLETPIGKFLGAAGITEKFLRNGEAIPPLARGIGPTFIPRPEKFYFAFGDPIDTSRFRGRHDDQDTLFALREEVQEALSLQLRILVNILDQDSHYGIIRKILTRL